jgi:hypothetical protein
MVSALMLCLFLSGVVQAAEPIIQEDFNGNEIQQPWQKTVAGNGTIVVKDGWVTFAAGPGGKSMIQRTNQRDNITVSADLARWAAIYLVWDKNNWCAVGKISPTPFGRFYSIAVVNGKPQEVDHRGVDFNGRHVVRIQLGQDHVSFQYSTPEITMRSILRPALFKGAPKLIIAGIAYTDYDKPFGAGLAADAEQRSGAIDDLQVEATPENDLTLTPAEIEAVKNPQEEPVNELLKKSAQDPTYEQIVGYYPPFRSPREIVGVADHPLDIGVDWLGRIDVSPWTDPLTWFEVGDSPKPLGLEGHPFERRLLNGYLPLITLRRTMDGVQYQLQIFGWSEDFSVTKPLIAYARLTASGQTAGTPLPAEAALVWDQEKHRKIFKRPEDQKDQASWCVKFEFPKPESCQLVSQKEFDSKWNQTAQYWQKRLAPAACFDLPDERVMEAYRAWIAYSLLNTDTINGWVEPHDGAGFYETMFGYSVSLHTMAMDQYGFHQYAANALAAQIHFQQPDGLYTQECGLCDPGSFLAALARHYQMMGDRAWLKKVEPAIVKQCDWLIEQRSQAPTGGMLKGIIKFRPYNDYPSPTYNYLGNAWCAEGMIECGRALADIGNPEAGKISAEGEQYAQDLRDSMAAATFDHDGATLLPMEPDTHRLLKMGRYLGGDYWGLVASPLLATDILPPGGKTASLITDMLQNRQGLIAGVCAFDQGIDHAYTYGYLVNEMEQGQIRNTLLGFWSFLAFGMTRDTYSPVEVTMIKSGENQYTLPHTYSCTQQLRLLRDMLLREDGQTLWIGQGIPRAWLEAGKHVAIKDATTYFGKTSYRLEPQEDGSIKVHLDCPNRQAPVEIRICLRDPQMREISEVQANSGLKLQHHNEMIIWSNPKGSADLLVRFGGHLKSE